ncbi:hypothetical protein [Gloeobacter kilaueensis]|nr:hypothetical protein [Gloeobacter kilaueensis]
MPMRRFEEAAETLEEEEGKSRRPAADELLDSEDLPRYLRRTPQQSTGGLVRFSLIATGVLTIFLAALAFVLRPEPNPVLPDGVKIKQGVAVLASPRGFTATLDAPGTGSRLLMIEDGRGSDKERDGFIWFKDVPSRTVPAGNYALELSAPGYQKQRLPVTVAAGRPQLLGYNTLTALKKVGQ